MARSSSSEVSLTARHGETRASPSASAFQTLPIPATSPWSGRLGPRRCGAGGAPGGAFAPRPGGGASRPRPARRGARVAAGGPARGNRFGALVWGSRGGDETAFRGGGGGGRGGGGLGIARAD